MIKQFNIFFAAIVAYLCLISPDAGAREGQSEAAARAPSAHAGAIIQIAEMHIPQFHSHHPIWSRKPPRGAKKLKKKVKRRKNTLPLPPEKIRLMPHTITHMDH